MDTLIVLLNSASVYSNNLVFIGVHKKSFIYNENYCKQ